jgi:C1A family cysteine protease
VSRKWGALRDVNDVRDQVFKLSRTQPWPIKVDLSASCGPVLDQGNYGSCTAHAGAGVAGWITRKYDLPPRDFSPAYLYDEERIIEGTFPDDNGAQMRTICKALVGSGIVLAADYPYTAGDLTTAPGLDVIAKAWKKLGAYHRLTSATDLISCLGNSTPWPVLVGFTVYQSFESEVVAQTGMMPMPGPDEMVLGGHAVYAVGYDLDTQRALCRNSWGENWGLGGNFWMPMKVLDDPSTDLWIIHLGGPW